MAPKVEPIMLWGFCFQTQQAKVQFNQSWACAFHTSWYTDERHPLWESLDDPSKRREIRYGNNIVVLFRALLHCKAFYGQDSFWAAVARGFNTNASTVRSTAEALTEARRVQQSKPSKDVPDTARAVDDWIDFLDSQPSHPRVLSDPEVYQVAEAFFHTQGKKLVNAARVPTIPRPNSYNNMYSHLPKGLADNGPMSPRFPPSPSVKAERPPQSAFKRPSPPPASDRDPKIRRFGHGTHGHPETQLEREGERDGPPKIQATRSPPRPSDLRSGQAPPSAPSAPSNQSGPSPASGPSSQSRPLAPTAPSGQSAHKPSPLPVHQQGRDQVARAAPPQLAADEKAVLQARIAKLEKQLAEAEAKPDVSPAVSAPDPSPSRLGEDMGALKQEMDTVTNVIGTMMESMHDIVDSLNSLQDEISGLSTQQKGLVTQLPKAAAGYNNLDSIMRPIQTLAESVNLLRGEVAELKKVSAATTAPSPAVNGTGAPSQTAVSAAVPTVTANLEALLHQQNEHIGRLAREMSSMRTQLSSIQSRPQDQPQQTQQQQQQQQTQPQQQPPQTLRQAMAAAERDLQHHLAAVQAFYHRLEDGRGGASRELTMRTADLLAALSEGLSMARIGQGQTA